MTSPTLVSLSLLLAIALCDGAAATDFYAEATCESSGQSRTTLDRHEVESPFQLRFPDVSHNVRWFTGAVANGKAVEGDAMGLTAFVSPTTNKLVNDVMLDNLVFGWEDNGSTDAHCLSLNSVTWYPNRIALFIASELYEARSSKQSYMCAYNVVLAHELKHMQDLSELSVDFQLSFGQALDSLALPVQVRRKKLPPGADVPYKKAIEDRVKKAFIASRDRSRFLFLEYKRRLDNREQYARDGKLCGSAWPSAVGPPR